MERLISEASSRRAEIVCFPEAYLPGLRGQQFDVYPFDRIAQERALESVARCARKYAVAIIAGMERHVAEGFRYPETVRWAAVRGARIVFHPQYTGSDRSGVRPTQWASPDGPYYEKAMMCRGLENTIYFASVNYALRYQEAATSLIDPSGRCQAHLPYGEEGVLVQSIDVEAATGLLAGRYAPERYQESESP